MKKYLLILLFFPTLIFAQEVKLRTDGRSSEIVKEAVGKAEKIVNELSLKDIQKKENAQNVIANRYMELADIYKAYGKRNDAITKLGLDKQTQDQKLEESYYQTNSDLYRSRFGYISWLSFYLTEKQIDQVKNKMTEDMMTDRYNYFLELLPQMTKAQKHRVYSWLVEAREFSIDFDTPRKMRQMFTKYRGRINNYLSSCGYDVSSADKVLKEKKLKQKNKK